MIENVEFDYPGGLYLDPRGNIHIEVVKEGIKITQLTPDGKRIEEFTAKNLREAVIWLWSEQKISDIAHALYLGVELQKAEIALKEKVPYYQDKPLVLKTDEEFQAEKEGNT